MVFNNMIAHRALNLSLEKIYGSEDNWESEKSQSEDKRQGR
jgi:hypothetical protein